METATTDDETRTISLEMIARRCVQSDIVERGSSAQLAEAVLRVTHMRLDRECVGSLENLEPFTRITNLYVQHNQIERIEGLSTLRHLSFLTLAHNRINHVSNLRDLPLRFLDLSHNAIDHIDEAQLPSSLWFLELQGNPCCQQEDYRGRVLRALPYLKELDLVEVTRAEREKWGCTIKEEEEEEEEEEEDDDDDDDDDDGEEEEEEKDQLSEARWRLQQLRDGIVGRSRERIVES